jgi:hypothetical protein
MFELNQIFFSKKNISLKKKKTLATILENSLYHTSLVDCLGLFLGHCEVP